MPGKELDRKKSKNNLLVTQLSDKIQGLLFKSGATELVPDKFTPDGVKTAQSDHNQVQRSYEIAFLIFTVFPLAPAAHQSAQQFPETDSLYQ